MNSKLKEYLFAPRAVCVCCLSLFGTDEGFICSSCREKLGPLYLPGKSETEICLECGEVVDADACPGCGRRSPPTLRAFSAYEYEGIIRKLVHRFKFGGVYALSEWMAGEMLQALAETGKDRFTRIVPVPMYPLRKLIRGYNQAEKLAGELSKRLDIPKSDLLRRVRNTKSQVTLATAERRKNLKNAFRAVSRADGERILLVDDVRTTGSTVSECARTLLAAGCESVTVLTFANAKVKEKAPFSEQSDAGNRT